MLHEGVTITKYRKVYIIPQQGFTHEVSDITFNIDDCTPGLHF